MQAMLLFSLVTAAVRRAVFSDIAILQEPKFKREPDSTKASSTRPRYDSISATHTLGGHQRTAQFT